MVTTATKQPAADVCRAQGHAAPSSDPRDEGRCSRCGGEIADGMFARDLEWEREATREAALNTSYVPAGSRDHAADVLSAASEERTGPGGWKGLYSRDMVARAAEEIADQRAYVLAELMKLRGEGRDDEDFYFERMLLMVALGASVQAHYALDQYRRRRDP